MAYQKCATDVIYLLKDKYPNKIWNKTTKEERCNIIFHELLSNIGSKSLGFDDEILIKVYNNVYKGLTIINYVVPLMNIDLDPDNRQMNEYDKDYDECMIEQETGKYKFNLT
jgi:hypothetical protein